MTKFDSFNLCPRGVDPAAWAVITGDEVDPTIHLPDVDEEREIAASLFWLGELGVENPILLSQIDSPAPGNM